MTPQRRPVLTEIARYRMHIILGCFAIGILYSLEVFFSPDMEIAGYSIKYGIAAILAVGGLAFYKFYIQPTQTLTQSVREPIRQENRWLGPPVGSPMPNLPQNMMPLQQGMQTVQHKPSNIWEHFDDFERRKRSQHTVMPPSIQQPPHPPQTSSFEKDYSSAPLSPFIFLFFLALVLLWAFGYL